MRVILGRLGGYGISVVLTLMVGLASVPTLIRIAGARDWAQLAVAQSVGALAAVLVAFGWGATGPTSVASTAPDQRTQLFWDSFVARTALCGVVAPIAVVASILMVNLDSLVATFACLTSIVPALGAAWYFVGEARPYRLLLIDAVPRSLGIVLGLVGLWATSSLLVYTAVSLAFGLAGLGLTLFVVLHGDGRRSSLSWRGVLVELGRQRHGAITTAAAAVNANSPLIIANAILSSNVAQFALALRLYSYALAALSPILQLAQGWVPAAGPSRIARRVIQARRWAFCAGACAAIGLGVSMAPAGRIFWPGSDSIPLFLRLPFGIALGAVLVSQIVGLACLTSLGGAKVVASGTVAGAVLAIGLLVTFGLVFGAAGLAAAIAMTELTVAVFLLAALRRYVDRRKLHGVERLPRRDVGD